MEKFAQLTIAELYADKGLHLESVANARDPRMRTIRVSDFWRGGGALEDAAAKAPALMFAGCSDIVLRHLGVHDQVLRAVRTIIDKRQLEAFATLLPEDQFEVLQCLAEGSPPRGPIGTSSLHTVRSLGGAPAPGAPPILATPPRDGAG